MDAENGHFVADYSKMQFIVKFNDDVRLLLGVALAIPPNSIVESFHAQPFDYSGKKVIPEKEWRWQVQDELKHVKTSIWWRIDKKQ